MTKTPGSSVSSLVSHYPTRLEIYLLLLGSIATLVIGLSLPTIEMKELIFKKNTFSILTGIQSLYEEKYYFLAGIIFVFSIIFPIIKLCMLTVVWLAPLTVRARGACVGYLEVAGKWSMLDVFVVALMIIITRTSGLIDAKPLPGIYWFAGSVILAMLTSSHIKNLHERTKL